MLVNQISLLQLLSNAAIARAGIVYTSYVQGVLSSLELESLGPDCGRVVVLNWQQPPRIDSAISETITELARVAASLWPDWPAPQNTLTGDNWRPNAVWREQAEALCGTGRLPLPADASHPVNVNQLCGLLGAAKFHIVMAVHDSDSADPGLDALCRVVTWITAHSHASALPENWEPGDSELAARYHRNVQNVIWTPGRQSGNPLRLEVIPDISRTIDDEDEFSSAIAMISGGLADMLSLGNSRADQNKRGILSKSLRYYAEQGSAGLSGYVELLTALPDDARLGIAKEAQLASDLADSLRVLAETDPMIDNEAEALDPAVLLEDDQDNDKTRVAIVNLSALSTLENQQRFINQLATTLFAWIKRHPVLPPGRGLRGLLMIDEARDFIPSKRTTACKDSLKRLTAQAGKYHLGVVFATQHSVTNSK